MKPGTNWRLRYAGGSNDRLEVWREGDVAGLRWDPVTPFESSSGSYSGGTPCRRAIPLSAAEAIRTAALALEADPSLRAPARAMGTGLFSLEGEGAAGGRRFLIHRGDALDAFEACWRGWLDDEPV